MRRAAIVSALRTAVGVYRGTLRPVSVETLIATVIKALIARTGLGFDKLDLVELNEAFACQVLSVLKGWSWNDPDRLNVNGSGISLGHPVGATGVRILTTLLNELQRRKGKFGLETMCVGSGQGLAAIFARA